MPRKSKGRRKCKHCGKMYEIKGHHWRYCSESCQREGRKKEKRLSPERLKEIRKNLADENYMARAISGTVDRMMPAITEWLTSEYPGSAFSKISLVKKRKHRSSESKLDSASVSIYWRGNDGTGDGT